MDSKYEIFNNIDVNSFQNLVNLMITKVNAGVAYNKINSLKQSDKSWSGASKNNLDKALDKLYSKYKDVESTLNTYNKSFIPTLKSLQDTVSKIASLEKDASDLRDEIDSCEDEKTKASLESSLESVEDSISSNEDDYNRLGASLYSIIYS